MTNDRYKVCMAVRDYPLARPCRVSFSALEPARARICTYTYDPMQQNRDRFKAQRGLCVVVALLAGCSNYDAKLNGARALGADGRSHGGAGADANADAAVLVVGDEDA